PAEAKGFFRRPARYESVSQPGGKAVAAADAAEHVELARRTHVAFAVEPEHGRPIVAVRRVHFAEGRRDQFDVGELLDDTVDHEKERIRVELRANANLRAVDPQRFLQIFFVAEEGVDTADDAAQHLPRLFGTAGRRP